MIIRSDNATRTDRCLLLTSLTVGRQADSDKFIMIAESPVVNLGCCITKDLLLELSLSISELLADRDKEEKNVKETKED